MRNEDRGRRKITRPAVERIIYLILIIVLVIYGVWNTEAAVSLIEAIKDAFTVLFTNAP